MKNDKLFQSWSELSSARKGQAIFGWITIAVISTISFKLGKKSAFKKIATN